MAKSKNTIANEEYREGVISALTDFLTADGEQVLRTKGNKIAFPFVNALGTDEWIEITVAVPIGSRKDNEPFDGYALAEEYEIKKVAALERERKAAEAKAKKKAYDEKRREIARKGKGG